MQEPVLPLGSNHRAAAVCLKIQCWVTFVLAILVAAAGLVVSLLALVGGAFWDSIVQAFGWDGASGFGALVGALAFVFILLGTVFVVVFMGLYLWWNNHTFHLWNTNGPSALVWANVFAVITLVMSLPSYQSQSFSSDGNFTAFSVNGNLVSLALAILILVFANLAQSKGELAGGSAGEEE